MRELLARLNFMGFDFPQDNAQVPLHALSERHRGSRIHTQLLAIVLVVLPLALYLSHSPCHCLLRQAATGMLQAHKPCFPAVWHRVALDAGHVQPLESSCQHVPMLRTPKMKLHSALTCSYCPADLLLMSCSQRQPWRPEMRRRWSLSGSTRQCPGICRCRQTASDATRATSWSHLPPPF